MTRKIIFILTCFSFLTSCKEKQIQDYEKQSKEYKHKIEKLKDEIVEIEKNNKTQKEETKLYNLEISERIELQIEKIEKLIADGSVDPTTLQKLIFKLKAYEKLRFNPELKYNPILGCDQFDYDESKLENKLRHIDVFSPNDFNIELFNSIFIEFEMYARTFEISLAETWLFSFDSSDVKDSEIASLDYFDLLGYHYSRSKRTPENIQKVFNEELLNHIASIFKLDFVAKDYSLYGVLEALLMTYEEMNDQKCDELYRLLDQETICFNRSGLEGLEPYISDKVSHHIKEEAKNCKRLNIDIQQSCGFAQKKIVIDRRIFYAYSFWARRYHEGNKETVYEILKKLNHKIITDSTTITTKNNHIESKTRLVEIQ
ncbi:hypothetical protein OAT16_10740 [Prolixibacteraceae bacterium]|nr:hypothetical protein [Prolixibacteraceae bacterium]